MLVDSLLLLFEITLVPLSFSYPTFRYFNYGKKDFKYTGGRVAEDFIQFMKDPSEGPPSPPPEPEWKDIPSAVNHLTENTFDMFVREHESVPVSYTHLTLPTSDLV